MAQAVPGSGYGFSKLQPKEHGCRRAGARQLAGPHRTQTGWGLQHQTRGEKKRAAQHERRVGREHWQHLLYRLEAKVYARTSGEETPGVLTSVAANVAFSSHARRHGEGKASKRWMGHVGSSNRGKFILRACKAALHYTLQKEDAGAGALGGQDGVRWKGAAMGTSCSVHSGSLLRVQNGNTAKT